MRHRCEACDQLVSLAGHNCPASDSIAILRRGAKAIGAKLSAMGQAFITTIQGSAPPLIEMVNMQERDPVRFTKAAELSKTTVMSFREAWDSLEMKCPECGALQLDPTIIAHGIGCSRGGAKLTHAYQPVEVECASCGDVTLINVAQGVALSECDGQES